MRILALLIYVPLQIVFIPFAVLGIALQTFRQMALSRRLGASQTGIEVLGGRWTMHHFGMREDRATIRLAQALLPGYLVPRLVREVPGARSKSLLFPREP